MPNLDDIVAKLKTLSLDKQHQVEHLIDQLHSPVDNNINNTTTETSARNETENTNFISSNGIALAIGDRVKILTNRKTGKIGDKAKVIHFNKIFVAVKLDKNSSITRRASKNLKHIP